MLSLDDIKMAMNGELVELTLPPLNIEVTVSGKVALGTALEQLQKVLDKTTKRSKSVPVKSAKSFSLTFSARNVHFGDLTESDQILAHIQLPSLMSPKENKIGVTLQKGKVTGVDMFGNAPGASLEVSLFSRDGTEVTDVRTNVGKTTNGYLSLVAPKQEHCEWKESLCIDLGTERPVLPPLLHEE